MMNQYFQKVSSLLAEIETAETDAMHQAAEKIAASISHNGIIHLFGCGHSHIFAEEVYYRAGGLAPVHPILHEPLMLHEGGQQASELERKDGYAAEFMEQEDIRKGDVFIVVSTSGRNPVPIDAALIAKEKGACVIGITSMNYIAVQPSRHVSGSYLYGAADLVINNHIPVGDALMEHDQVPVNFSPGSTVIGAAILNAIMAEAVKQMAESGADVPVFLSGNVDGASEHNQQLIEKYKGRIKF